MVMDKSAAIWVACVMSLATTLLPRCSAQNEKDDYLALHDFARFAVDSPRLAWEEDLAYAAEQVTITLSAIACQPEGTFTFPGFTLERGNASLTGAGAVQKWIAQKANYDYATNSCTDGPCEAYLQVVWNTTENFGCARVICRSDPSVVLVNCLYEPPGLPFILKPY